MENINPPANITISTSGVGSMPGEMMQPTISRTVQLMRHLTIPETVLPRMIDDTWTGQSSNSSKLM